MADRIVGFCSDRAASLLEAVVLVVSEPLPFVAFSSGWSGLALSMRQRLLNLQLPPSAMGTLPRMVIMTVPQPRDWRDSGLFIYLGAIGRLPATSVRISLACRLDFSGVLVVPLWDGTSWITYLHQRLLA